MEEKKRYRLYDQESKEEKVKFEIAILPLQDEISSVRRVVSKTWNKFSIERNKLTSSTKTSLGTVNTKVKDAIKSAGVKDTGLVIQASAIGSAALLGVFLARKKTIVHQILYPVFAGSSVWAICFCSMPQNRTQIYSKVNELRTKLNK